MQWHAGENVGCGKDYTIFSKVDGIVIYSKKKDQSKVWRCDAQLTWGVAAAAEQQQQRSWNFVTKLCKAVAAAAAAAAMHVAASRRSTRDHDIWRWH
jgi:hypothetical protein